MEDDITAWVIAIMIKYLLNTIPIIISIYLLFNSCTSNKSVEKADSDNINAQTKSSQEVYKVKQGSVFDGDTLRLISESGEELKVRFACIDAPEMKMKYGSESRDYLRSLLSSNGNKVNLNITNTDRYGRQVAVLYLLNGEAVQVNQVKNGWVYPYPRYKDDCPIWNDIEKAEAIAKNSRVSIYSKELVKPWDYRRK